MNYRHILLTVILSSGLSRSLLSMDSTPEKAVPSKTMPDASWIRLQIFKHANPHSKAIKEKKQKVHKKFKKFLDQYLKAVKFLYGFIHAQTSKEQKQKRMLIGQYRQEVTDNIEYGELLLELYQTILPMRLQLFIRRTIVLSLNLWDTFVLHERRAA